MGFGVQMICKFWCVFSPTVGVIWCSFGLRSLHQISALHANGIEPVFINEQCSLNVLSWWWLTTLMDVACHIFRQQSLSPHILKKSLCKMSYWKPSDWIVIIPIAQSYSWWEPCLSEEIDFQESSLLSFFHHSLPTNTKRFYGWYTIYPSLLSSDLVVTPATCDCWLTTAWSLGLLAGFPPSVCERKRKGRP